MENEAGSVTTKSTPPVRSWAAAAEALISRQSNSGSFEQLLRHVLPGVHGGSVDGRAGVRDDQRRRHVLEVAVGILVAPQVEPAVEQRHGHQREERDRAEAGGGEAAQLAAQQGEDGHHRFPSAGAAETVGGAGSALRGDDAGGAEHGVEGVAADHEHGGACLGEGPHDAEPLGGGSAVPLG